VFVLKKDRNCGCGGNQTPYPVYPTYPGMIPMMNQGMPMMNQGMPMMINQGMGMPNNIMMPTVPSNNTISNLGNDFSSLSNQISNLERRVSRLESMMNSSNNMAPKYNESNYYMV